MKKRLILVRHAAAQQHYQPGTDRDRAITLEGMHELEAIRANLQGHFVDVSIALCSNARRARQTLEGLKALLPSNIEIIHESVLYKGSHQTLWSQLRRVSSNHNGVLVVGHNPYLTNFVLDFDPSFQGFPTCSVGICQGSFERWSLASPENFELTHFLVPTF